MSEVGGATEKAPGVTGGDRLLADDVGQRVVRGGAQRATAFVVSNLLAVGGAVIVLRYLGVAEYGRYGTVAALLTIVYGVTDAGLSMTATRELAVVHDEAERRELLAHVIGLRVALTSIGVALAIAFSAIAGYSDVMVVATAVGGVGVVLSSVQGAMVLPLTLELRNGAIAALEVVRQAVLVALFCVVVAAGGKLPWFFGAQLAAAMVLLAITPIALQRGHLVAPRWSRRRMSQLLLTTLPLAIAAVLGVVYFRLLVILMSLLSADAQEVGLYATSARVVEIAGSLPYVLIAVLLPVVTAAARDDRKRLDYMTGRTVDVMALAGILLALVLAAAARPVVLLLGGPEYEDASAVLRIQAPALVTIFLSAAWSATLIGLGRQRWVAIAAFAGLLTALAGGAVLIPAYEARGAAIAAVLADAALCLVTYAGLRRASAGRNPAVDRLVRFVAAAAPGVALVVWDALPALVSAGLAGAVFVILAWLLGLVPNEIGDAARRGHRTRAGRGADGPT